MRLSKTWVGATVGNAVRLLATQGFTNNTAQFISTANTASETDTGAAVTVYAGDTGTIRGEVFTNGVAATYQATLSCNGGTLSGTNALVDNTLTIMPADAGKTIVCAYRNARIVPVNVTKSSTVVSDGISASNPLAIPGARVRYCILITNPGTLSATDVTASDALPGNVTFIPGSMRSGTSCTNATTVEDDNNTGADESDPFGMSYASGTVSGTAVSLAGSGTYAMVFDVTVN